ncbi:DUF3732 domain-containing protein [Bradyrhizobium brasilense]|uniref:DUF3732 domain-containing protein n=1 Tax=Bradyrhizobium brasilense TaxID=1419277 RepID=A0ABY8JCN6_9BRAD|nr:DUF3732 domain-containing protein [Bradyrhizobium brasilense]WFU62381.1 DUF3732 domain-containing protein [Bradyrhizobium brasilense]
MNRWNVREIAFYGNGGRRRTLEFDTDKVNVITGASGTGKSAIIDAIDYCLGSSDCKLPFFVRNHAEAVAVHWTQGDSDLIVGRKIPKAGSGTNQMYVRSGRNLKLPDTSEALEGPTNRDTARALIEKTFGIQDTDNPAVAAKAEKGRATIRDIPPYLFLSGDVIISRETLLHDLNRPEKARDIKATIPYFLGAVDQASVLAARTLRQLEAALAKIEREASAQERSQSLLTQRSMALLTQAQGVGLVAELPSPDASDKLLLDQLAGIASSGVASTDTRDSEARAVMEDERRGLVSELQTLRAKRQMIKQTIREATGYETAVSGQSHKLRLVEHLKLDDGRCPVCDAQNSAGQAMAEQIRNSLSIVANEVLAVDGMRPRLDDHSGHIENLIGSKYSRLKEVEAQLAGLVRVEEESVKTGSLLQERARVVGRIDQFLETTAKDFQTASTDTTSLVSRIEHLRDRVDPQARRERLRDAENMVSAFATEMLVDLPTEVPATGSRVVFSSAPNLSLVEPSRRAVLAMAEIGSDQNYLAIHLALAFSLQKLFETIKAPVPGLLVIDQISRPYYPKGGDEKRLREMEKDDDQVAMQQIVRFLFDETARQAGLQVILIEHAYIEEDPEYVAAVKGRWTKASGVKLIPSDWPLRN